MIFCNEDIVYEHLDSYSSDTVQMLTLLLEFPHQYTLNKLVAVTIYRSPQLPVACFRDILNVRLLPIINCWLDKCPVIIVGDFNMDLLDKKHSITTPLLLNQFVSSPTCIAGSLMDDFYWSGHS